MKVRNLKTGRRTFTLKDGSTFILNSFEEKEITSANVTPTLKNAEGIGDVSLTETGEDPIKDVKVRHANKKSGGEE